MRGVVLLAFVCQHVPPVGARHTQPPDIDVSVVSISSSAVIRISNVFFYLWCIKKWLNDIWPKFQSRFRMSDPGL